MKTLSFVICTFSITIALATLPGCSSTNTAQPGTGGKNGAGGLFATGGGLAGTLGVGGRATGAGGAISDASASGGAIADAEMGGGGNTAGAGGAASDGGGTTARGGSGAGGAASGTGGAGIVDGGPRDASDARPDFAKLDIGSDLPKTIDAEGGYQPCPDNGDPCKILPLGDSITWGARAVPGYRTELFAKVVNAQQKITFTGSLSNGPDTFAGQIFPKRNEGHSGWRISTANSTSGTSAGIAALIPSPAMDSGSGGIPHIILLHIGTNDAWDTTGAEMANRLSGLLDKLITAAPDALLVVAKLTPLNANPKSLKDYNDAIPGLVLTRASAGKHIKLADMNTGFPADGMSSDGIHPNQSGYDWMGDQWYALISSYLPK